MKEQSVQPNSGKQPIPFSQLYKEERYWTQKLAGELLKSSFPYDLEETKSQKNMKTLAFQLPSDIAARLIQVSNESDYRLQMGLIAGLVTLLDKYTGNKDIILGTPTLKQDFEADFINTVLPLRSQTGNQNMTFKDLLLQVKQTIIEANEHQNYPMEQLVRQLGIPYNEENGFPLFAVAVILENIQDRKYIQHIPVDIIFSFIRQEVLIKGTVEYDSWRYHRTSIERIISHFLYILAQVLFNVDIKLMSVELLTPQEKETLIFKFNDTVSSYPEDKTLPCLVEEQVEKTPDRAALLWGSEQLTYRHLNEKANRLAWMLKEKGVKSDTIVAAVLFSSPELAIGLLGILKSSGAYLPLDPWYPRHRLQYMLQDCGAKIVIIDAGMKEEMMDIYTGLIKIMINKDHADDHADSFPGINPAPANKPGNIAYVIYTSGTSGRPKGVLVEHKSIVNTLAYRKEAYKMNANAICLQLFSYAFDGFITGFFTPLISGARVILLHQHARDIKRIVDAIVNKMVSHFISVPSLFQMIIQWLSPQEAVNLKVITLAGEMLSPDIVDITKTKNDKIEIVNEYGVTEAAVLSTIYRNQQNNEIKIGRPIWNTEIYIKDEYNYLSPISLHGEMCIGGTGIARGYLNKPELTFEKFIENPFKPGNKLYRSGDLARWTSSGDIELLGRLDQQVKLRGFRIELGEIKNKLSRCRNVKDVVVTIKEKKKGEQFICAYIVTGKNAQTNESFDAEKFRNYLAGELPDYMIPAYFINIDSIPLTPNGKLDSKALPDPLDINPENSENYVPPKNEIEKNLVQIWQNVLGRDQVGVNENFFMMGGDSIKSIQVLSRMNQFEYKVEMKELFQNPTIAQLAPKVKKLKNTSEQLTVSGKVPLTPVQEWFFETHQIDSHHFNQAVLFRTGDELDEHVVKAIFTKIQEHHDALRMTYKKENGQIIQFNHGLDYPLYVEVHDFRNRENCTAAVETKATEIQAGIDLENGPMMKLGLFHLDQGDRLLVVIHHLVVDAVSWRILFEDIDTLYRQYRKGEPLSLSLKTDSFKMWREKLSYYANSEQFLKEKVYWKNLESTKLNPIREEFAKLDNYRKDAVELSFILSKKETHHLLTKGNEKFNTEINDILLTALGIAIKKTWGHNVVLISLEGHGREQIIEDINISRTVGWFTNSYPLLIDISYENDLGRQIKEVKETIRKVPHKGIGYGILKYITGDEYKKDIIFQLNPQFGFNYLGQFDTEIKQMSFQIAKESPGMTMSSKSEREFDFDISGVIADNRLGMSIAYNKNHYKTETIKKFIDTIHQELKNIIAFCCSKKNIEKTPSDFTHKGLSIETIDRLTNQYHDIEDIYKLTPMQEGMLFHALYDEKSYSYFEQISYRLQGKLDMSQVEKSLHELVKRHDILRTAFVYRDIDYPVQVVLKAGNVDFYYEDIRHTGLREEKENFVRKFKASDKSRGFDLTKGRLMRVSIIEVDEAEYEFIWSFHHILMDGWCVGILNADFLEIYNSFLEKRPHRLGDIKPYRTYIQWLQKQDREASASYWQNYLDAVDEQTSLPKKMARNENEYEPGYRNELVSVILAREKTAGLNKLAAGNHVTLNIVTQTLWGIILGKYNNKEDVIFGSVVSGRPFELESVESMVGLFINTVPVRIRFERKMKFNDLLKQVQQDYLAGEPHHYHPLAEIQSGNPLKQNLIDNLFIFENYPIAEQIEGYGNHENKNNSPVLKLANIEIFEQTNYDFNIELGGTDQLAITFRYNRNVYDEDFVKRISKQFTVLIDQVIQDEKLKVGELTLLAEEEKNQLLFTFNEAEILIPIHKSIYHVFEEHVERTADRIAVKGPGLAFNRVYPVYLTYGELNERSNRLAYLLMEKGIQPDNIIGIMMERSIEMLIGLLGIFKSGGAYLPIDLNYPLERIDYMLKDSGAKILLVANNQEGEKLGSREGEKVLLVSILHPANHLFYQHSAFCIPHSNHLAYLIYTSGSTGKPKGVMIEHIGMLNHINVKIKELQISRNSAVAQNASHTFDISVWQFFAALVQGGKTVIYPEKLILNPLEFISQLIHDQITILEVVPSYLSVILSSISEKNSVSFQLTLKYLLVTGEELKVHLVKQWFETYPGIKMINAYGPTEASDDITHYIMEKPPATQRIPIGKPLSNLKIFILDENMNLCPIGVKGEIYVAGIGVGRGYLNKQGLTAEKFIDIHILPFSLITNSKQLFNKIYKTGDLGCWLPDGTIEFFGRKDYQVKIRGFRIELAEIEKQILKHGSVKEGIVIDKEDKQGNKYLCAYIIGREKLSIPELKDYLAKQLPAYMVPAFFVALTKIPLTANGKIDRKALPDPKEINLPELPGYSSPNVNLSAIEKKLIEIWEKVLAKKHIRADENFFMIGGDSIKAIQIISRMSSVGYKLEMRTLFQYPVISELATHIKKLGHSAEQTAITGIIPLTPVQEAFFYEAYRNPHHYNQAVMLYSREGFDQNALKEVFAKIQEHHDALRMTYKRDEAGGKIIQFNHGSDYSLSLQVYDFSNQENERQALEIKANEIQASIDLEKGPLMKLGLFHLADGDRLLIAIHHLVIDGVSWRILFENIETLYRQYKRGEKFTLPPKTDSFKLWSEKISAYADSHTFLKEKAYWGQLESAILPRIPNDFEQEENKAQDALNISIRLNKEETSLLLTRVNHAFGTEINDILLTALGLGIKKTFGHDEVLIALEGHGREDILADFDISRTVGWFTSVYPVLMNISYAGDLGRQIKEIKETLRRIPNKGIGHGILKYLTSQENKKEIHFKLKPQISFNYLGQFDVDVKQMTFFEIARESAGNSTSMENHREYELDINGMISRDCLVVIFTYNNTHFKPETMSVLVENFQSGLRQILAYCSSREKREFTPSDFTYKGLSIENINRLMTLYPDAEDIYTLTPMQEGMLFHALYDETSFSYFEQISYRLEGELEINLVEKSLHELVKRHDILRTAFIYEDIERSVQVVLKERIIDFYYKDISGIGDRETKEVFITEFKEKDKRHSFDLKKDVLMRVSIHRTANLEFEFTWSFHHILMDGWCVGILNTEFFEIYTSYLENRPYHLPVLKPYRTYIQWLEKQDKEKSAQYWENYLDSYDEPTGVPRIKTANTENSHKNEIFSVELDLEKTAALNKLAGENNVTSNTLIQAIWGILLGKYNSKEDVVFGAVVSGRPSQLEGVESMIGLFINTIPVRICFVENMKFPALLQKIQEDALSGDPYHYHPLVEIQSRSPLKQNLIDHVFIFENYPIAKQIEGYSKDGNKYDKLKLTNIDVFEQNNYDFNVIIMEAEQLKIILRYNGNMYGRDHVKRICDHFMLVIDQVLADSSRRISGIEIISEATRKELLSYFNANLHEGFKNITIQSHLENVFRKYKANTAIECGTTSITYEELEHKAAYISQWVAEKNILPGNFIGIYHEDKGAVIAAIIGILQKGCIFVPLDISLPRQRIENMICLANMPAILTDNDHEAMLTSINKKEPGTMHIGVLNNSSHLPWTLTTENNNVRITYDPDDKIYVYFTSGTTGLPNAIVGRNKSLVQFLQWEIETFAVTESDRISQLTAVGFDAFLRDIFVPFFVGGTVCIPSNKEIIMDGNALSSWLDANRINLVHCVPSLFRIIDAEQLTPTTFSHLKYVLLSGEPINPIELQAWYRVFGSRIQLVNYYGPTETTMIKTYHFIQMGDVRVGKIPAGFPIKGARIIILDKYMKICDRGIVGEIYIRTAYSTHGYLYNPSLNNQRFIKNPFSDLEGDIIYKTGDLGRQLENGEIEVLGRIDRQVKIRGIRIELENIENCLLKHAQIEKSIVINHIDKNGENYLCAYILYKKLAADTRIIPNITELRNHLLAELPDYMIPSYFVPIDKIPLTANGKLDLRALPEPRLNVNENYVPPRDDIEKRLVELWSGILGRNTSKSTQLPISIGIDDNFFELGGHSLTATILVSKIHKLFDVKVPLVEIFKMPRIKDLAKYIKEKSKEYYISIVPAEKKEYYFLSSAQKRLFILQQMSSNSIAYNMPDIIPLPPGSDRRKIEETLKKLIEYHESLRTSFQIINDIPIQEIHDNVKFAIEILGAVNSESKEKQIIMDFIRPFDLSQAPLIRVGIFQNTDKRYILIVDMHHIISDGISHAILEKDFMALYKGEELLPLRIQYKDFAEWQNSEKEKENLKLQEKYWLEEFAGEIPVLELPTDYSRPLIQSFEGDMFNFEISSAEWISLKEMALAEGATLFMIVVSVTNILLAKLSGQEDIIIGTPIAGRRHADLEKIIGMFVNTLSLRNYPARELTFREFLGQIKKRMHLVFENQEYPFEELVDKLSVRRDIGRNPLFDVMIAFQSINTGLKAQDKGNQFESNHPVQHDFLKEYENRLQITKFDLILAAMENDHGLFFTFQYATKLFKKETIERFTNYLKKIVSIIITQGAEIRINDIEMISELEKRKILNDFNKYEIVYPQDKMIHQLFAEQVERTPDNLALVIPFFDLNRELSQSLTYQELNAKANRLAYQLKEKGIGTDSLVGLMVERSVEMFIGIFGILKAGGAYLPIDPEYPKERIDYMLKDSSAKLVIGRAEKEGRAEERKSGRAALPRFLVSDSSNLAYIIYTSGTTGKPKGVLLEHRNVIAYTYSFYCEFDVNAKDIALQQASFSFDAFVEEVFPILFKGGKLVLARKEQIVDANKLSAFLLKHIITFISVSPLLLNEINKMDLANYIRIIISGGDKLKKEYISTLVKKGNVYNTYGPTETTVCSTYFKCSGLIGENIPIGKPIANYKVYILNENEKYLPIGVPGELCISGEGVARGYLNRPELTAERFKINWSSRSSRSYILYNTGDLARWLPDGNLEFLGRIDHQVKLRGYRIELEEIENCLLKINEVKEALVLARENNKGDTYLCAYIVSDHKIPVSLLKENLSRHLPDYMIPSFFIKIERIPLTRNGKIDLKALPVPEITDVETFIPPRNKIEQQLAVIWAEVLKLDKKKIGIDTNFFQAGGQSLKAAIMVWKIHEEINLKISLAEIFQAPTIRELAHYLNGSNADKFIHLEAVEKQEYYPLSSAQKRLYLIQQMDLMSTAYNMPEIYISGQDPGKDRLKKTFLKLLKRHESLRTSFKIVNGHPFQHVHDPVEFEIEYYEISKVDVIEKERESKKIIKEFIRPFDLAKAPLIHVGLLKEDNKYTFMVDMHHIISDGISHSILVKDFIQLYGGAELPQLNLHYKDFTYWQNNLINSDGMKKQEQYWLNQFAGDLPELSLPFEEDRQKAQDFEGDSLQFEISMNETDILKYWAKKENATLFMILLAIYNVLLSKISGQEDIIVGVGTTGRQHADLEKIIGMFVNNLALRNYPISEKTFIEFLREVRERTLQAFANQDYLFEDLVDKVLKRRDLNRNPLFDTVFMVQDLNDTIDNSIIEKSTLNLTPSGHDIHMAKFDMFWQFIEAEQVLLFSVTYRSKLFKKETIDRFISYFKKIISEVTRNNEIKIKEILNSFHLLRTQSFDDDMELDFFEKNGRV